METSVQQAARLLVALDEMIELEHGLLRGAAYDAATELRERAGPLVRRLVELSSLPGVGELAPRVNAVVERSTRHAALLQEKMEELGAEIRRTDQARHRAAQLAPVYSRPPGSVMPRFLATS